MRLAWAGLLWLLAGCSLGQPIARQAIDYNHAVETAANGLLVTNILRARDEAPLHFTSMPQIRGSLSLGLGQPGLGLPVGPLAANGLNLGLSGANSPSFDVSALDTQDFIRGLLEPLEPGVIRYYWDRGYPDQMLLMLLFSSVDDPASGQRLHNDPRCWLGRPDCPGGRASAAAVRQALELSVTRGRPTFNAYTALVPLGGPLNAAQLAEAGVLALATEGKLRLVPLPGGRFQPYRQEARVASCYRVPFRGGTVLAPGGNSDPALLAAGHAPVCTQEEVVEVPSATHAVQRGQIQQIHVRSVQEIIHFLGTLVRVQLDLPRQADGSTDCVPFILAPGSARQSCLFQLLPGSGEDGAVTVEYGGKPYHVPPYREPGVGGQARGDYSMRVLALLSDLVNLKKSSSSIPSTRAVQIVR